MAIGAPGEWSVDITEVTRMLPRTGFVAQRVRHNALFTLESDSSQTWYTISIKQHEKRLKKVGFNLELQACEHSIGKVSD